MDSQRSEATTVITTDFTRTVTSDSRSPTQVTSTQTFSDRTSESRNRTPASDRTRSEYSRTQYSDEFTPTSQLTKTASLTPTYQLTPTEFSRTPTQFSRTPTQFSRTPTQTDQFSDYSQVTEYSKMRNLTPTYSSLQSQSVLSADSRTTRSYSDDFTRT